jgi:hypothetical protein
MKKPSRAEVEFWYNKLAESGFEDIEHSSGKLKENHNNMFARKGEHLRHQKRAAYYAAATDILNTFKFSSAEDRGLWELHADGKSIRMIAKELGASRMNIQRRLQRIKSEMLCLV